MAMMTGKYHNMSDTEFLNSLDDELVERFREVVKNILHARAESLKKDYVSRSQHEALRTQYVKMMSTNKTLVVKLKQQIARGNTYREVAIISESAKCNARRAEMQRAKAAAMSSGHFQKVRS